MRNMVRKFMINLKIDDVNNFAINKGVNLTNDELKYTYEFIKKNWEEMLANPKLFNIDRYKENFGNDTFLKIKKIYQEYLQIFSNYL